MNMRILLVEDDRNLSDSLAFQLEKEGFTVDTCFDGDDGLHWTEQQIHDLILLDRMLPGTDGIQVLEKMRQEHISTPVILITALGGLNDKIEGLDSGADDYIVKPFAFEELMARIRCINRRPKQWDGNKSLAFGDITFYDANKQLAKEKMSCTLSKREADLMELFIRNPDQVLPREVILSRVWGSGADVEDGNLDNYIHFLRRRLKTVDSCLVIKTIRGIGYRLENGGPF